MAREHLELLTNLRNLHPGYDECPRICQLSKEKRKSYCGDCQVKRNEELFREDCTEQFKLVEGAEKYEFDSVLGDFYNISSLEAAAPANTFSPDWTVLTAHLVSIIRGERNRLDRIRDYNERKKLKNIYG